MIRMTYTIALPLALAACASQMSPSSPSPTGMLTITANVAGLRVGEEWRFSTVNASGQVLWSSDHPDVCSITQEGLVTARGLGSAAITASDTKHTVTTTVHVVPDLDGGWAGQTDLVSSTRISGAGPEPIAILGIAPYSIRIGQEHDQITAYDSRYQGAETLRGTVDAKGVIHLRGSGVTVLGDTFTQTTMWTAVLGPDGKLNGSFTVVSSFSRAFGPQVIEAQIKIIELRR